MRSERKMQCSALSALLPVAVALSAQVTVTEARFQFVGGFDLSPSDVPEFDLSPRFSGSHTFESALVSRSAFQENLWGSGFLDELRHYAGRGTWMHSGVFSALGHFHSGSGAGGTRAMATQVDPGAPKRLVGLLLRGMATEGSPGPGVPLAVAGNP